MSCHLLCLTVRLCLLAGCWQGTEIYSNMHDHILAESKADGEWKCFVCQTDKQASDRQASCSSGCAYSVCFRCIMQNQSIPLPTISHLVIVVVFSRSDRWISRAPVLPEKGSGRRLMELPWPRECELPLDMIVKLPQVCVVFLFQCTCVVVCLWFWSVCMDSCVQDDFATAFLNALGAVITERTTLNANVAGVVVSFLSAPALVRVRVVCQFLRVSQNFWLRNRRQQAAIAQTDVCVCSLSLCVCCVLLTYNTRRPCWLPRLPPPKTTRNSFNPHKQAFSLV